MLMITFSPQELLLFELRMIQQTLKVSMCQPVHMWQLAVGHLLMPVKDVLSRDLRI